VLIVHNERPETIVLTLSILSISLSISSSPYSLCPCLSLYLFLTRSVYVSLFLFLSLTCCFLSLSPIYPTFLALASSSHPTGILSKSHYDSFPLTTPCLYFSPSSRLIRYNTPAFELDPGRGQESTGWNRRMHVSIVHRLWCGHEQCENGRIRMTGWFTS
jgi:hypothetical protein